MATLSKGVHPEGPRLEGICSDLHFQKKLMTLRRGSGKGCKWEVRLAALEGVTPPGDIQEAESKGWALTRDRGS